MRRINSWTVACACATMAAGLSPPLLAGPYSSGSENENPGAVDPAIAGLIDESVNPAFAGWATNVVAYEPAPGVASEWSNPGAALGAVTGEHFDIVSLGDLSTSQLSQGVPPGRITLSFTSGIRNSTGADFAVFENALSSPTGVFAELGYVEVSSDGMHFARFPSASLTPGAVGPFGSIDPTNVHNLAGKHINNDHDSWGTPFDLSDLADDPLVQSGTLNLRGLRLVRIVDIPGDGSFLDSHGMPIYDAWPTTGSGGFDLEAIGVLNPWLGGDANFDGIVDAADLGILALNWQMSERDFTQGDFDRNGVVDIGDLLILADNWDAPSPVLSVATSALGLPRTAVPEPAKIAAVAAAGYIARRRRI